VLFEIGDHLGSTGIVIEKATGELVEQTTYTPYGATESDYRPLRWDAFREDYRFTGKEEDSELGLVYFGARYYAPLLGRWASPDPLAVHGLRADPNLYAYLRGKVYSSVDERGLDEVKAPLQPVVNLPPVYITAGPEDFLTAGPLELPPEKPPAEPPQVDLPHQTRGFAVVEVHGARDTVPLETLAFIQPGDVPEDVSISVYKPVPQAAKGPRPINGEVVAWQEKLERAGVLPKRLVGPDGELRAGTIERDPEGGYRPEPPRPSPPELYGQALAARDEVVRAFRLFPRNEVKGVSTVVGGYNKVTGEVTVGTKWFDGCPYCAEDVVVSKLGGERANVILTPALRPYGKGQGIEEIPPCAFCSAKYYPESYAPGVSFAPRAK
jgi:RHS repeat-associated protein